MAAWLEGDTHIFIVFIIYKSPEMCRTIYKTLKKKTRILSHWIHGLHKKYVDTIGLITLKIICGHAIEPLGIESSPCVRHQVSELISEGLSDSLSTPHLSKTEVGSEPQLCHIL